MQSTNYQLITNIFSVTLQFQYCKDTNNNEVEKNMFLKRRIFYFFKSLSKFKNKCIFVLKFLNEINVLYKKK